MGVCGWVLMPGTAKTLRAEPGEIDVMGYLATVAQQDPTPGSVAAGT